MDRASARLRSTASGRKRAVVPRPHSFRATSSVRLAVSSRACLAAVDAPGQVFPRSVRSSSCVSPLPPLSPYSFRARHADLEWANLAEGRLRLDRLPATAAGRLSSPAGPPRADAGTPADGIPRARQESLRPAVLRCAPALRLKPRVRFDRPRPVDRHRGRDGRGPTRNRRVKWRPSAASRSPTTATMPAR